jgi:alkylhydroperoxidase family enzyme
MKSAVVENVDLDGAQWQGLRQREQLVLGMPPRLLPLADKDIVEIAIRSTQEIRKAAGSSTPVSADTIPELVTTLLRHPDLYRRIVDLSIQLQANGALSPRDRQLAILRAGWLCQAPYEWGEHVKHSRRIGFSSDEIERVTRGSTATGWDEHDSAILRAVEELHADAMIADATWEVLTKRLDDRQLIELSVLVGQFTTVAYLQNSLRLRLAPGNIGLQAR